MAYQNIGNPRFFGDLLTWWHSHGLLKLFGTSSGTSGNHPEWLGLNPSSIGSFESSTSGNYRNWLRFEAFTEDSLLVPDTANMDNTRMFSAILGHNLASVNKGFASIENTVGGNATSQNVTPLVNDAGAANANDGDVPYDGFSLRTFDPGTLNITGVHFRIEGINGTGGGIVNIGSCAYGVAYRMPHSPELSLTMTREMNGVKRTRTKGGADLVNYKYTKPAMWGDLTAWEIDDGHGIDQALSRVGRRSWNLSFNYLSGSTIFPDISNLNWYESYDNGTPHTEESSSGKTLLDADTFYSQVILKTNGGQLPFIFQPDSNSNAIDNLAICKFDMRGGFKFKQVANGIYNIKLKIREVW